MMEAFPFPPFPAETVLGMFSYKWLTVDVGIYPPLKYACWKAYSIDGNFAFNLKDISLRRRGFGMFEEMASDAVKMLILFFWTTLGFAVIWGALWLKASKKAK